MQRLFSPLLALFVLSRLVAQDPSFVHEFGAPGARGSFRASFDDRGAGLFFLQTMDHFTAPAAAKKAPGELVADDYMLLVFAGADYSFLLREADTKLFGEDPSTARWQRQTGPDFVRFELQGQNGLRLSKTFRHRPAERGLLLELELQHGGSEALPVQQAAFVLSGPALVNRTEPALFGTSSWAIAAATGGDAAHLGASADGKLQQLPFAAGQELSMAGSSNRFFGGFVFPLDDGARRAVTQVDVESLPRSDDPGLQVKARSMPRTLLRLNLPVPAPGGMSKAAFGVYLGPKSFAVFDESPEHARFLPILDVDLEPPCCGSIVVPGGKFMATTLVRLLEFFHGLFGVWGLAIMVLTVLVRGCLAPLNFRMQKSMRAYGKRMAEVRPKLDKLREKHQDDPKALQQAMIAFQREHKLMPPLGGCLPIFMTMPIYIGLFTALRTAYDLRHQGFLFMQDLSAPDGLFDLPFWPHLFNVLPLVWIALMLVLQSRMPLPSDPQQRQMQQIMRYMPLMFGVLLYNYASGLMVYMVTSMVWTFGESAVIKKVLGPIDPDAAAMAPAPVM